MQRKLKREKECNQMKDASVNEYTKDLFEQIKLTERVTWSLDADRRLEQGPFKALLDMREAEISWCFPEREGLWTWSADSSLNRV